MGNTLRVIGIIVVAMVLGLTSLVLVFFTICGGFESPGQEGAVFLGGALVVLMGGVGAIVWLARGIASNRPHRGLAVAPAAHAPAAGPAVAVRREPLARADLQLLVLLRVVLAVYILASLAMAATSFTHMRGADMALAVRFFVSAFVNVLPPALALVLLLGNPPAGVALDLALGSSVASLLWRMVSFLRFLAIDYNAASTHPIYLLQIAIFTMTDIAIVVLALMVRRRVDTGHPGRMAAAILGFLVWEWLVQMVAMLAY